MCWRVSDGCPPPGPASIVPTKKGGGIVSFEMIKYEAAVETGVARITLNRPEQGNRTSLKLLAELRDAFGRIRADKDVRVAILTGSGTTFVGGGDTDFFLNTESSFDNRDYLYKLYETFSLVERLPQPVIAAVNGWAIGAGAEPVASCDFSYAARSARLSMPECIMGMVSNIQAALFPYYMPIGKVREWLYTGDAMSAEEAERCGLVNRVVEDTALQDEVLKTARKIASYTPLGVQFQKELVNMYWLRTNLDTAMWAGPNFSAMSHSTGIPKALVKEAVEKRRAARAKKGA